MHIDYSISLEGKVDLFFQNNTFFVLFRTVAHMTLSKLDCQYAVDL